MKTLVVYDTQFGNTEHLSRNIAEALHEHGEARVAPVVGVSGLHRGEVDLLVVGGPTQGHGLPSTMESFLRSAPAGTMRGTRALAFDTRYRRPRIFQGSAAHHIAGQLRRLGCQLLAPPESFFVTGEEGPLEPGEVDRARGWALHALGRPEQASAHRAH